MDIDLNSPQKLNERENWTDMFGSSVEAIMAAMFGGYSIPVNIKGTKEQIRTFANVLKKEKKFLEAYKLHGLDNPMTYRSKFDLNKAVSEFERKTGIVWPFR